MRVAGSRWAVEDLREDRRRVGPAFRVLMSPHDGGVD